MNLKPQHTFFILAIFLILLVILDIRLSSAIQHNQNARKDMAVQNKLLSLSSAQLQKENDALKKQFMKLPVRIYPAQGKDRFISDLSSKAASYSLDITSLSPTDVGTVKGLEEQEISLDMVGSYKNTIFFLDDLVRSGHALTMKNLQIKGEQANQPVRSRVLIRTVWSVE